MFLARSMSRTDREARARRSLFAWPCNINCKSMSFDEHAYPFSSVAAVERSAYPGAYRLPRVS